jgi:hypothetical protein
MWSVNMIADSGEIKGVALWRLDRLFSKQLVKDKDASNPSIGCSIASKGGNDALCSALDLLIKLGHARVTVFFSFCRTPQGLLDDNHGHLVGNLICAGEILLIEDAHERANGCLNHPRCDCAATYK